jgi:hypothetical protein
MLIEDLPEEIRVLALKNQVAQGNPENLESDLNDSCVARNFD